MADRSIHDPMYREFADTDLTNWPYVTSPSAVAEMKKLAKKYHLGFFLNPGGGEWFGDGFDCQISTYDDVADLNRLREALRRYDDAYDQG